MYFVLKTLIRTVSDSTNVNETSFWEIQCELTESSKEREKGLVVSIVMFTNS